MSPLPISRSALDRLGERLAAAERISDDDYALLHEVLSAYQAALGEAGRRLAALGYEPTTRVKTTSVLIDKLRREQGMKLKGEQDIAGARIVSDCNRVEQDEIVRRIVDEFANESRPPKVKDRRAEPSAGYRAVHVIVTVQDVPVEIQVRTWLQDRWAQAVEALADKWGRGLRYGEPPLEPDRRVRGATRRTLWEAFLALSSLIDLAEERQVKAGKAIGHGPAGADHAGDAFAAATRKVVKQFIEIVESLE
jgi:ppGpp synthetase/RelA/SpoT-type nucleotidyltranferase